MNIDDLCTRIDEYNKEVERVSKIKKDIQDDYSSIELDLSSLKNLPYTEVKDIGRKIKDYVNEETIKSINAIVNKKKGEEYPEWLGVYHYPEIKEMTWLDKESQRALDQLIGSRFPKRRDIEKLDNRILEFLIDKGILERLYLFNSNADNWDCNEVELTEKRVKALKEYWYKEANGIPTTEEEDKLNNYGCFEIWSDDSDWIEISSLEEFEENLDSIRYRRIKYPDTTLDFI